MFEHFKADLITLPYIYVIIKKSLEFFETDLSKLTLDKNAENDFFYCATECDLNYSNVFFFFLSHYTDFKYRLKYHVD